MNKVTVVLRNPLDKTDCVSYTIQVHDTAMADLWYQALQDLLRRNQYLEKNFCFLGFPDSARNLDRIGQELTWARDQINQFFVNEYYISETYTPDFLRNSKTLAPNQAAMNLLHNHFEHLQGTVQKLSDYYLCADYQTKFAIRQLNNLCHEAESLMLSQRKQVTAPEWIRPSQITTFLNAPRIEFPQQHKTTFDETRYNRRLGEVYLHWSQIGKTLYEVYRDECGVDINSATCNAVTHLRYYSGEFDIEWAQDVVHNGPHPWHTKEMLGFRSWLERNGFDPDNPDYNFGYHPVGQVDLLSSFGTEQVEKIWPILSSHLDIYSITAGDASAVYNYTWTDADYYQQQIAVLQPGYDYSTKGFVP
jgi:hypothetical protein